MGRVFFRFAVILLMLTSVHTAFAVKVVKHLSPRNKDRSKRTSTDYIILHTTEGGNKGGLAKVHKYGEAHYLVNTSGKIYQIISTERVAYHAGRSMWNGTRNIDYRSIGIEVVGYHNRDLTSAQYKALKSLLSELQKKYGISDERVLTHSMVAYGAPNRWHKRSHRGRKRCGMQFAKYTVRVRLGLTKQPKSDPDVAAGRLVVADSYLQKVLYGSAHQQEEAAKVLDSRSGSVISASLSAWDIARDRYNDHDTIYIFPDGKEKRGDEIKNWKSMKPGTKVLFSGDQGEEKSGELTEITAGASPSDVAGSEVRAETTVYFLPDGQIKTGDKFTAAGMKSIPAGTKVLVGYVSGGKISARRSAFDVCGASWNSPSTYYRFPNRKIVSGSDVKETSIPAGALVFYQN